MLVPLNFVTIILPEDNNSIINGDHWYRISTTDENFYPSSAQRELHSRTPRIMQDTVVHR